MKKYIKPPALAKGDTVGIVSPASTFFPENIRRGVRELRRLGFKVRLPKTLYATRKYTLSEDKQKAKEIHALFRDPEVKAIFCAKGGYGCIRLLPHLDENLIRSHPKILMGYSDESFLLNFLISRCGMVSFHGPMVVGEISADMPHTKEKEMLDALMRRRPLGKLSHKNIRVLHGGKATGILLGGCLTSLVRMLGTPFEVDTIDAILFLEDVSESPTNIDEMLFHLKIAGKLKDVRGIVFGQMYNCGSAHVLMQKITQSLTDIQVPILFGFPSGHSFANVTLPLGVRATVDANVPALIVRESAVS